MSPQRTARSTLDDDVLNAPTQQRDSLHRFILDSSNVRGEVVHLDAAWQSILARRDYPDIVREHLGQSLAAVALLTSTLKIEGSLILQIRGRGPLNLLTVQGRPGGRLRGLARWNGPVGGGELSEIFGADHLVITIDPGAGAEPYQGIAPLQGTQIADALRAYFDLSVQLPTRLWLEADRNRAAGLLLQELPGDSEDRDAWNRALLLGETLRRDELLTLPAESLLHRLYNQERLRLFEPLPQSFHCGCSRERLERLLAAMGRAELESVLEEKGVVEVNCEFCNANYRFDPVDVERLLSELPSPSSSTRH